MSDSEDDGFCYYGKALDPYDEDSFPKRKPISIEEQVATDAQGRRRFHGAFTGGFSAGFFNTVGSLEGWLPSDFKSSREDKAQSKVQKPEDFMDDEDLGDFGIAPQTVKATGDYSTAKKRKKQIFADGPIPGEPVLQTILESGNDTIGYLLLRNMSHKHKKDNTADENDQQKKVYGCEMPKLPEAEETIEGPKYDIPEVYTYYLLHPKNNSFGLGYTSLSKSHIDLFQPSNLSLQERNNKKVSISGQAFGVGAFEDDDEDIYKKDDMSKYDFELTSEQAKKKQSVKQNDSVLDNFVSSKTEYRSAGNYPPPAIPHSFSGKHKVRKSRFEPVPEEVLPARNEMDAAIRGKYLGEEGQVYTPSKQQHRTESVSNSKEPDRANPSKMVFDSKADDNGSSKGNNLFSMFDRFVSASQPDEPTNALAPVKRTENVHGTEEMRQAARMKMFGPLTRVNLTWQPCTLLCKRFNVPEPCSSDNTSKKSGTRTKHLIFEYQKQPEDESLHKPGLLIKPDTELPLTSDSNPSVPSKEVENVASHTESKDLSESETNIKENAEIEDVTILDTDRVDVSKNLDLFKAIFLSSSESESEDLEEALSEDRNEVMKANVLTEQLVPKIKPLKEGILSNVCFTHFDFGKLSSNSKEVSTANVGLCTESEVSCTPGNGIYGPRLPEKIQATSAISSYQATVNCEEWVEKDLLGARKVHKHKKKSKKHKDKKHRSKH